MNFEVRHLKVEKTARYYALGKYKNCKVFYFALHGYGQQAERLIKKFDQLPEDSFVVAPEALSRFYWDEKSGQTGASWMTKDDREFEIEDYCNYLQTVYQHYLSIVPDNCKIVLLGFSQGGATAMRWLVLNRPEKIDALQLWGSDIPADLDYKSALDYLSDKKIYWIYGLNDPYINAERAEQLKKRFYQFELHPEIIQFEGAHEIDRKILGSLDLEIKS
jgi:predicted esterase